MRILAGTVVALMLLTGAARAADADDTASGDQEILAGLDDIAVDSQFQCPETIADADAQEAEIQRYYAWAAVRHPEWNFRKRVDVRYGLLRRHACAATIAKVDASARPAFGP